MTEYVEFKGVRLNQQAINALLCIQDNDGSPIDSLDNAIKFVLKQNFQVQEPNEALEVLSILNQLHYARDFFETLNVEKGGGV
jgi:hypothetical protein